MPLVPPAVEHGKISASESEFLDGLQISTVLLDLSQVTVKARRPACIVVLPCLSLRREFWNVQCCKAGETAGIFNYFVILYVFIFLLLLQSGTCLAMAADRKMATYTVA